MSAMPLPVKHDTEYKTPMEFLEARNAAQRGKKPPMFLNSRIVLGVLIAAVAVAILPFLLSSPPKQPDLKKDANIAEILSSFDDNLENLNRAQKGWESTWNDCKTDVLIDNSPSSWDELGSTLDSLKFLVIQRKSKWTEVQALETMLRSTSGAYQSLKLAADQYTTSALASMNILRKNALEEESLRSVLNGHREKEIVLHAKLSQLSNGVEDILDQRAAIEGEIAKIKSRIVHQQDEIHHHLEESELYEKQIDAHDHKVAAASENIKRLSAKQSSLNSEMDAQEAVFEQLKEQRKDISIELDTLESLRLEFLSISKEALDNEALVSLKLLKDAEEDEISKLAAEIASARGFDDDSNEYQSGLIRSRLLRERVKHELRYDAILFISKALPVGSSGTFAEVLEIVDSHIEKARERFYLVQRKLHAVEDSLALIQSAIQDQINELGSVRQLEQEAGSRRKALEDDLTKAQSALKSSNHALADLKADLEKEQDSLISVQKAHENSIDEKQNVQRDLQTIRDERSTVSEKLQSLNMESKNLAEPRMQDLQVMSWHLQSIQAKCDELRHISSSKMAITDALNGIDTQLLQQTQNLMSILQAVNLSG